MAHKAIAHCVTDVLTTFWHLTTVIFYWTDTQQQGIYIHVHVNEPVLLYIIFRETTTTTTTKNIINDIVYMYLKEIIHVNLQYSIDHKLEPLKKIIVWLFYHCKCKCKSYLVLHLATVYKH